MSSVEEEIIAQLEEKILVVGDQLKFEQKQMERYLDMVEAEKGRWAGELKKMQIEMREHERETARLERSLEQAKPKYLRQMQELAALEKNNASLNGEFSEASQEHEVRVNRVRLELDEMESEMHDLQEQLERQQEASSLGQSCHDKEIRALHVEHEARTETEINELKHELSDHNHSYRGRLTEMEETDIARELEQLGQLQAELDQVTGDCRELEKSNLELEGGIAQLQEPIEYD